MKVRLVAVFLLIGSPAVADILPVPPIPPESPPLGDLAPMPNIDARAPPAAADPVGVDVKFYRARPYDPGLGFAPGSRYQSSEDRKPIQTPGLSFSVPLR